MPNVSGVIRPMNNNVFFGTFEVDGDSYLLGIILETQAQSIDCSNAILTYDNAEKLVEICNWTGTISKNDLQMDLGGGVSIAGLGPFETAGTIPVHIGGTAQWERSLVTEPGYRSVVSAHVDEAHKRKPGRGHMQEEVSVSMPDPKPKSWCCVIQ